MITKNTIFYTKKSKIDYHKKRERNDLVPPISRLPNNIFTIWNK